MHIELSTENKNKLLLASGKAQKSAGFLVNMILDNIDIDVIHETLKERTGYSVLIKVRTEIKKEKVNI